MDEVYVPGVDPSFDISPEMSVESIAGAIIEGYRNDSRLFGERAVDRRIP